MGAKFKVIFTWLRTMWPAHQAYSAAMEALTEGEDRPILKIKLDTAPSNGEYVPLQDTLDDALQQPKKH